MILQDDGYSKLKKTEKKRRLYTKISRLEKIHCIWKKVEQTSDTTYPNDNDDHWNVHLFVSVMFISICSNL